MYLVVFDRNGNRLGRFYLEDVEASRVEGLSIKLSDNSEVIVVTLDLEES